MTIGNLNCDHFMGKPFYPIEWRQVMPGTVQIILSLFIIFASYIFKQSIEAMLILDFAHARYGCPEILAMVLT